MNSPRASIQTPLPGCPGPLLTLRITLTGMMASLESVSATSAVASGDPSSTITISMEGIKFAAARTNQLSQRAWPVVDRTIVTDEDPDSLKKRTTIRSGRTKDRVLTENVQEPTEGNEGPRLSHNAFGMHRKGACQTAAFISPGVLRISLHRRWRPTAGCDPSDRQRGFK